MRVLMGDLIANSKVQDEVDSFQSLWFDCFGDICTKGLASFGDLFNGILGQFQGMVLKMAANQLWNSLGLGDLLGSAAESILGGGGGAKVTGILSLARIIELLEKQKN